MSHVKRAKLFYIPGIISLIGVSILFYFFKPAYQQQYALNFFLANDKPASESLFSSAVLYAEAKRRKQTFVDLGIGHTDITHKFVFIEQEILRLACSYGPKPEVLIVKLDETICFKEFVQLLNLALKYGLRRFGYAGDSFYFFGLEPEKDLSTISSCFILEPIYLGSAEYVTVDPVFIFEG